MKAKYLIPYYGLYLAYRDRQDVFTYAVPHIYLTIIGILYLLVLLGGIQ